MNILLCGLKFARFSRHCLSFSFIDEDWNIRLINLQLHYFSIYYQTRVAIFIISILVICIISSNNCHFGTKKVVSHIFICEILIWVFQHKNTNWFAAINFHSPNKLVGCIYLWNSSIMDVFCLLENVCCKYSNDTLEHYLHKYNNLFPSKLFFYPKIYYCPYKI